jgi:hypothetical protein
MSHQALIKPHRPASCDRGLLRGVVHSVTACVYLIIGISIIGCDDPPRSETINGSTRRVLFGKAWFVTDDDGDATAAWLGGMKFPPPITDATLAELTALPRLTALYVHDKSVTDAGMEHLASMAQLEVIDVSHTSITDRGLQQLESLKELKVLCLAETQVTDAAIEHFKSAVPGCDVRRKRSMASRDDLLPKPDETEQRTGLAEK